MEKQLNFALKLSLEELALRSVVVNLWNEKDILSRIQGFHSRLHPFKDSGYFKDSKDREKWKETVQNEVHCRVSKLLLPESLKKRMVNVVNPIGHQILRWKSCQEDLDVPVLEQLCWKSIGTVDYLKTAEKLVLLETIDVAKRYRLACWHCLEDYIPRLWEELPEEYKSRFPIEFGKTDYPPIQMKDNLNRELLYDLQDYWARVLKKQPHYVDDIHFLFYSSASAGNKAATEYLFQKFQNVFFIYGKQDSLFQTVCSIIPENRQGYNLLRIDFGRKRLCDVFCYLLSLMTPEQQIQIIKKYPRYVLTFFLFWPWQDLFLDIADLIWNFLPEREYPSLTNNIHAYINTAGYYFPDLIQKILLNSPSDFKKDFAFDFWTLESTPLFNYDDTETLKAYFRNVVPEYRLGFISGYYFPNFIRVLILRNKLHVAELCIREISLSKEEKWTLKRNIYKIFHEWEGKEFFLRMEHFFKFLDGTRVDIPEKDGGKLNPRPK